MKELWNEGSSLRMNFGGVSGEKEKNTGKRSENFKRDFKYKEEQEVKTTPGKIKKILRKMPNWKAPGPDFVQGWKISKVFKKNFEETCKNAYKMETLQCGWQRGEQY